MSYSNKEYQTAYERELAKRFDKQTVFTRQIPGTLYAEDLWLIMKKIKARHIFANEEKDPVFLAVFQQIAVIVGKTYAERSDYAQLSDDIALMMIRDLLLDMDPYIMERNRDEKLPQRQFYVSSI